MVLAGLALGGCAGAPVATDAVDRYETSNRATFELNQRIDRAIVRPAGVAFGAVAPEPVRMGVNNVVHNLDLPGDIVNNLLQARIGDALTNLLRLGVNSTLGLAGIFDPASDMGLAHKETDFGETLHVWGAGEGAYLVVPVLGPTTERDLAGTVVDMLSNPTRVLVDSNHKSLVTGLKIAEAAGDRYDYLDTIDALLYDSADPYEQARLGYLQNRRHVLGDDANQDYFDPYEDPYGP